MFLVSCAQPPTGTLLPATLFSENLKSNPEVILLDVRTPAEFAQGHLPNALNINWKGNDFESGIASLDKSKPVFVYCQSGGRSTEAAKEMRAEGFIKVFELEGGILKWRAAGLPESRDGLK